MKRAIVKYGLVATAFLSLSLAWQSLVNAENWPDDWPTATPESEGFSSGKLDALWTNLTAHSTTALLVVRNDKILFERYAAGDSRNKPHGTASLAKALVGGTSLMLAMDAHRIDPDDLAAKYAPQWASHPAKRKITIRQLATHTSGIEDAESEPTPHDQLTGWKGDFWKHLPPPNDSFTLARDAAPVLDPPGTRERYSNPGMAMLGYCLTASLLQTTNQDLASLLRERVLRPLGVPETEWSVGYGRPVKLGDLSLIATWGGASFSPNAVARIGRLLLHQGKWEGHQLISAAVVEKATTYAGLPNHSGLGWWVNRNPDGTRFWKAVPADAFSGSGAGHQFLLVVPSKELIVVRNGRDLDPASDYHVALETYLISPLMGALGFAPSE